MNLKWTDQTVTRSATGSSQAMNWAIRSSAYDPDPALSTGAIPGFVEYANLYSSYCVHSMSCKLQVGNADTAPICFGILPSLERFNVNSLAVADCQEYFSGPKGKQKMLGSNSAISVGMLRSKATADLLVSNRFRTDLDYSSPTNTNPVELYWLNFMAYKHTSNFSNPLSVTCEIVYEVEFFGRRALES
jgi:hypothetical protein